MKFWPVKKMLSKWEEIRAGIRLDISLWSEIFFLNTMYTSSEKKYNLLFIKKRDF